MLWMVRLFPLDGNFNDGQWHYVIGTWNGLAVSIYVDGIFQGDANATVPLDYSSAQLQSSIYKRS